MGLAWAQDAPEAAPEAAPPAMEEQFKAMSGMSILGNNEAPKSLVLVPWKSSQICDGIGVVESLNNRPTPVDRDVFARELHYYDLRTSPDAEGRDADDLRIGSR
jgi:hypothetical protein